MGRTPPLRPSAASPLVALLLSTAFLGSLAVRRSGSSAQQWRRGGAANSPVFAAASKSSTPAPAPVSPGSDELVAGSGDRAEVDETTSSGGFNSRKSLMLMVEGLLKLCRDKKDPWSVKRCKPEIERTLRTLYGSLYWKDGFIVALKNRIFDSPGAKDKDRETALRLLFEEDEDENDSEPPRKRKRLDYFHIYMPQPEGVEADEAAWW